MIFLGAFYRSANEAIENFRDQYHLTFPVGKASGVARELWVETVPQTIFLSRTGRITRRIKGRMSKAELFAAVEDIVRQPGGIQSR